MTYEKPLPVINEDNAVYWEYCRKHELRMQKCSHCGHIRFPASILCPECHSMDSEWTKLSGKGKVYSYIIYRLAYHPSYKDDIPYTVGIIHLDEGPRLESNITGCQPEDIQIDMPVQVYFDDVTEDISLPKFRPVAR
jgi:uncharacterized OB-fold protein